MENKAMEQLRQYGEREKSNHNILTTSHGRPLGQKLASLTMGVQGPLLLQDVPLIDEMAHFDRERIPERVVHAKGAGAFGYFEVTHDISKYTKACVFNKIGKRTPMAARFSTVSGEAGSADTARDPRGFALKFYTEDGIWDLVANNTPIFFIRDPILFPSFVHILKRNPVTHLMDPNMFWDFLTLRPESCHQLTFLFGDRGIPDGYRFMNGYGGHAFKVVNARGVVSYCKFHFKSDQGIKNLMSDRAKELRGSNPDYAIEDLYNAIANDNPPSWTLQIQIMSQQEAETCSFDPFDITKIWPHANFPLMPVGKMVLNRNPGNYFAEVEQIGFDVGRMIPGIEASPDRMLQGRLFSYSDTQRYRLGPNFMQIPVNCPFQVRSYQSDGKMCVTDNNADAPNYYPNSFSGPKDSIENLETPFVCTGIAERIDIGQQENFLQCRYFWGYVLKEDERVRLIENLAQHLKGAYDFIQQRAINIFAQVDSEYGRRLNERLDQLNNELFMKIKYFSDIDNSAS